MFLALPPLPPLLLVEVFGASISQAILGFYGASQVLLTLGLVMFLRSAPTCHWPSCLLASKVLWLFPLLFFPSIGTSAVQKIFFNFLFSF